MYKFLLEPRSGLGALLPLHSAPTLPWAFAEKLFSETRKQKKKPVTKEEEDIHLVEIN